MSSRAFPSEKRTLKTALRDCEDELASSLCRVNVVSLCESLLERCVISGESYDCFTSLDHSRLKPQLLVRYLLRLAGEGVGTDTSVWESLMEVLSRLEGVPPPGPVIGKIKLAAKLNAEEELADGAGAEGSPALAREDIFLSQSDVGLLTELLVKISHKWELVAISLKFLGHEIEDCRRTDNKVSLHRVLERWVLKDSEATLHRLIQSLCSDTVGERLLAKKLETQWLGEVGSCRKRKEGEEFFQAVEAPRIVSQSLPTNVADGKSTLLQVQASPRQSVLSYQWKKDGRPLANRSRYSGVDEDILVVRLASQGTEGEYTCNVSVVDRQVTSNPITLTIVFPTAKKHLLNLYSTAKEVPVTKNSWPPVVSKTFINLALIKSSWGPRSMDFSVRGDADDVIAEKEKVEYEEVFGEHERRGLVLVEGRPGGGKTTLAHKVAKDWALGEVLVKSKLVFLILLRQLNADRISSLEDILHQFYHNKHEIEVIVEDINREDGEGACFLMDGLDECRHPNLEHSVIDKLLEKTYLPQSMVVVFTRPSASKLVNDYLVSKHIEVFGFSKRQIWEYIDQFPFEESSGGLGYESCLIASQLKDFVRCHANIHDMCYLPIHVAMICFLFQFSKNVPSSQTQVYEEFTRLIIHRHLQARGKYCEALLSLKDLDGEDGENFKDVCHLAYNMTVTSKLMVSSLEVQPLLRSGKLSEKTGLGLLTICTTLYQTGIHDNYSFLHLTFQEFLAAYYLANYLDENQQLDAMQQFSDLTTVWIFFSGLINFETRLDRFYKLLEIMPALPSCLSAFESQQEGFCDEISRTNSGELVFDSLLTATELVAIAYVVTSSSVPVTKLIIDSYYDYDDDRLGILFRHLLKAHSLRLNFLRVHPQILDDGTKHLIEVLRLSDSMSFLDVNVRHELTSSARDLANQINSCNHLEDLRISYSGTPDCIRTFVACMRHLVRRWTLSLRNLDVEQIMALGKGIKDLCAVHLELKMSKCDIDENCMVCLVDGVRNINSLYLDLSLSNVSSGGITSLAGRMHAVPIHGLNLSCSLTVPDSASALADGLTAMTGLVELNLTFSNMGPHGASALACSLKFMTKLRSLKLSDNYIGPDGAIALAAGLKHVSEMETLELANNNGIGPIGAIALAGVLQSLAKLRRCILWYNNVNMAGAMAVLCSLKKCQHLEILDICHRFGFLYSPSACCDIVIEGLVSPDDKAAMADLMQAAQHEHEKRTLHLGFTTIEVPPKNISF